MARILILLIILGVVWFLIGYLPLEAPFPMLIRAALILFLIWELIALGGYVPSTLNRRRNGGDTL